MIIRESEVDKIGGEKKREEGEEDIGIGKIKGKKKIRKIEKIMKLRKSIERDDDERNELSEGGRIKLGERKKVKVG